MGTWSTGPFDNDSAADFAYEVQNCSEPQARNDLLMITIRAGIERLSTVRLDNVYSWGYELEQAVAATAFVADEYTGEKRFTDCSYARGVGDDDQLNPYVEFLSVRGELVAASRHFLGQLLVCMKRDDIEQDWVDPIRTLFGAVSVEEVT